MSKYTITLLVLMCLVGYGSLFSCHTCTDESSPGCIYGTTQRYDMKDCASGQDRCFRASFDRGDSFGYERGCANQDFCTEQRSKQNSEFYVRKCELCDSNGCNSGSLNF